MRTNRMRETWNFLPIWARDFVNLDFDFSEDDDGRLFEARENALLVLNIDARVFWVLNGFHEFSNWAKFQFDWKSQKLFTYRQR